MKKKDDTNKMNKKNILYQIIIFLTSVILIVFFMPRDGKFNYQFELNSPWKYGQLIAPFDFLINKSEKVLQQERDSLVKDLIPYYDKTTATSNAKIDSFAHLFNRNDSALYLFFKRHNNNLQRVFNAGIISGEDFELLKENGPQTIMVIENNIAQATPIKKLYTPKTAYEYVTQNDTSSFQKQLLRQYNLNNFLVPNIVFNEQKTEAMKQGLISSISQSHGLVKSGQKIIDRGDLIDENLHEILESMRIEWDRRLANDNQVGLILAGQIIFTVVVIALLLCYINIYRKDFFQHKRKLLLLFTSIIFFTIVVGLMMRFYIGNVFMLPLVLVPMMLKIFMDSRTAFIGHVTMILLCSIMLNYPYEFLLLQTVAGLTAIYGLRELSLRSHLFRATLFVVLTYAIVYFAYELVQENDLSKLNYSMYIYFLINGVLLLFAYPLMYIIEKVFGFTSNVTLVELSNINHGLLRELSETTPGTFNHSLQVSILAAEAAHQIGADSQLVRTAALYHDIGKMNNPIYFTENQQQGVNPHACLSYEKSAQIIINHVTDGLKLADKYHLPKTIKDFIATHHGKGKTKYFFISYKNEHPGKDFDESVFTYPGPNPSTKEMAILMMADAVEATSKSLTEYTEEKINAMVDKIIDGQVAEGFFTQCPLTFKEISSIKTVLKEKLKSIYHTRINYPEENKDIKAEKTEEKA